MPGVALEYGSHSASTRWEEGLSSIIRNPSPPESATKKTFRVIHILPIISLVTLAVLSGRAFMTRNKKSVDAPPITTGLAEDIRLKPYEFPESAENCADWTHSPQLNHSTASFELPGQAELLFFLSRGSTAGQFKIVKGSYSSSHAAEVTVTAQYINREDLEHAQVCRVGNQSKDEHGLRIWAPKLHQQRRNLVFNVTVALPGSLREYNDISTDLPHFSHHVGSFFDFWSPTSFRAVRLKSVYAPVDFGDFAGEEAYIETSDAEVVGFFAGTKSLAVQTSNARVRSTGFMLSQTPDSETQVNIETSNAPVEAFLTVVSDYSKVKLTANIVTSNGALNVTMPRQGLSDGYSSFYLTATTSNGPSTIYLHPDYEGSYELKTSWAKTKVEEIPGVSDPSGKQRTRTVRRTKEGTHAEGSIFWSKDGQPENGALERGKVIVRSTNSPITLHC